MKFPPVFTYTPAIKQLLYDLDVLKAGYELHPVSDVQAISLRRASFLRSSLFSARIEGNPLELADVSDVPRDTHSTHAVEVSNLVAAYEHLQDIIGMEITVDTLKKLHAVVLKDISGDTDHLRTEESAIYNQSGTVVYL